MQRKQEMMTIVLKTVSATDLSVRLTRRVSERDDTTWTVCAYQGSACRFTFAATD